ncbi:MAG: pantetheine-phosphate adenylyltransferase [Candidatus Bipolaricaulota bacterium]|nr:MAG: pantetheine-phosphate adenylyltransferase [Candidatus Bipolaricaulota bacterium]
MDAATAIYPGSFDPITNGHLDILNRAREVFPRVVVAVANDPGKAVLFPAETRLGLVRCVLKEIGADDVEAVGFDGLLAEFARTIGARALIRGLRAVTDFEYELQMALANRRLDPDLETVFLMAEARHCFLSSSLIKEVARYGGDVSPFVPRCVADALRDAFRSSGC